MTYKRTLGRLSNTIRQKVHIVDKADAGVESFILFETGQVISLLIALAALSLLLESGVH